MAKVPGWPSELTCDGLVQDYTCCRAALKSEISRCQMVMWPLNGSSSHCGQHGGAVLHCKMIEASRIGCAADILVMNVVEGDGSLVVNGVSSGSNQCPDCGELSSRRKGGYTRHLQDLPVQGVPVRIVVHVTRWRCGNHGCRRHSFAEQIEKIALPRARQTSRIRELAHCIGHAAWGRAAERLLRPLGIPHSDDTIMRLLKREAARRTVCRIRVAGIDDLELAVRKELWTLLSIWSGGRW